MKLLYYRSSLYSGKKIIFFLNNQDINFKTYHVYQKYKFKIKNIKTES